MARRESYYDILTQAIADMTEHGYDSAERVAYWQRRLREAAEGMFMSDADMQAALRAAMQQTYKRLVDDGGAVKLHPGVSRFTVERLRPQMRAELDRRIMASADLIRLNKKEAVDLTLKRFAGWSTSLPKGGAAEVDRRRTNKAIRKSMTALPFEQRRLLIDQSAKLQSSINEVIANDAGAIAAIWHSRWRVPGYNYRVDHKDRDLKVYAVRGCWALEQGLMNKGAGYTDDITRPAEEPFCRCHYQYLYNLRQLPESMLTVKGKAALADAKAKVAALREGAA